MSANPFEEIAERLSSIEHCLLDLKKQTPQNGQSQPESDKFLNVKQTAELLGVTVPTVYGYTQRGEIPVCKRPGTKRLLFSKEDLILWIKEGRRKTVQEIEAGADQYLSKKKGPNDG